MTTRMERAQFPRDPALRAVLSNWARAFLANETSVNRVVERTINVACDDPEILNGTNMDDALFALLHRHALEEIHLTVALASGTEMSIVARPDDIRNQPFC